MKQILIILGLFASVSTFAQSPRIKLNQITKDTVKGSVLISSPSDSGMVYSRDFYIAYGADTVLILYGDTLAATSGIISSVLSDGVTITGNGTIGNELRVDTATVISTIQGLIDSLANYVTLSGAQTITGAKTFTNTFTQSGGDANFDSGTLYVDESENKVGIGTSSPQAPLSVAGSIHLLDVDQTSGLDNTWYIYNDTDADSTKGSTDASFFAMVARPNSGSVNHGPIFLMRGIDNSKYPPEKGLLYFAAGNVSGATGSQGSIQFVTGTSISMEIKPNGNVGIGTSSPSYKLDVVGDINASGEVRNSGVILTSDARYKKDITPLYNANDKLMLFNPVSYYWNDLMLQKMEESKSKTKTSIKYGLVAQEVEAIMPEFVSEGEDGYKAIDYQAIITLLIKSNQEQQTEINQLKTLITDLTNRLIILENK